MSITRKTRTLVFAGIAMMLGTGAAHAQGTISDVVTFLMTNQAVQTEDFERDREAAEIARDTIARALLVNLTSVPIATSSSGFLYRLNPELGTVQRASQSFGAFFTERALTPGNGRASFGIAATTSEFTRLNGHDLTNGSFLTIANNFPDESAPFDTEWLTLNLRTSTLTLLASVGVTDRLEIGGAVPLVRLELDGERLNVYRGERLVQASASGTASGIADVALRAKYTIASGYNGGVAAAAEVRLPTGDEENLLGAGSTSVRIMGVGSLDSGPIGLHANGGIVRGGISDEYTFAGALSMAVRPRVTISAELFGRYVSEVRDLILVSEPHPTITDPPANTLRLTAGTSGTTLLTALAGFKWNITGTVVLGGHVAWPLAERGLTARVTPTVALEYAFPR